MDVWRQWMERPHHFFKHPTTIYWPLFHICFWWTKPCYVFGFNKLYWKDFTMTNERQMYVWKNDAVFPSIAFKHPHTICWPLFQTCFCWLMFCYLVIVLLPWQLGVLGQFGHQLQITLKHPIALGEVLQLGYISYSIILIWKVV